MFTEYDPLTGSPPQQDEVSDTIYVEITNGSGPVPPPGPGRTGPRQTGGSGAVYSETLQTETQQEKKTQKTTQPREIKKEESTKIPEKQKPKQTIIKAPTKGMVKDMIAVFQEDKEHKLASKMFYILAAITLIALTIMSYIRYNKRKLTPAKMQKRIEELRRNLEKL